MKNAIDIHRKTMTLLGALVRIIREGATRVSPENAPWLTQLVDVTIDPIRSTHKCRVVLWMHGKMFYEVAVPYESFEGFDDMANAIDGAFNGYLDLIRSMHMAWLSNQFPNVIKKVTVINSVERDERIIYVEFKNGHVADTPERLVRDREFLAKCTMLHDLPPI